MHVNIPDNSNSKEKVSISPTSGLSYYSLTMMLPVTHMFLPTVSDIQKSKVLMTDSDL